MAFALYAPAAWTGWLGRTLSTLTTGLFGTAALILPPFLLSFSLMFFLQKQVSVTARQTGALFLIYLIASSLLSLIALPYQQLLSAISTPSSGGNAGLRLIVELWQYGRLQGGLLSGNRLSGGLAGGLAALSLERVAGLTGSLIILFALLITVLVYAFGLSPSRMAARSAEERDEGIPGAGKDLVDETGLPQTSGKTVGFFARLRARGRKDQKSSGKAARPRNGHGGQAGPSAETRQLPRRGNG